MKTIMILSRFPDERLEAAISTSRKLGYKVVFCGSYVSDTEDSAVPADVCYFVDFNDKERLVTIAVSEQIDGVISVCDPAVISASYIANKLNLPGNPIESAEKLLSKNSFRDLQEKAGVYTPQHFIANDKKDLLEKSGSLCLPLIVKPMLCSSSFGQSVITDRSELSEAFDKAAENSRNGLVCVEEFVERGEGEALEADVFVVGDDIIWDGIRYNLRSDIAELRPVCDIYPVHLTEEEQERFKSTVSRILRTAGVKLGEYNVEGFFTKNGDFFVIEINPRPAGYDNPRDIQLHCGVDLIKLLVTSAVGDLSYYEELKTYKRSCRIMISYSVFSEKEGILDHIHIDSELKNKMIELRYFPHSQPGDQIEDIYTAHNPIAKILFEFETESEMLRCGKTISELVYPVIKEIVL